MSQLGADYSWARPGGAALKAAGVVAVGRYLASDGRGITAAEYADLKAHGIGVWLVREGSAAGILGGFAQGAADARLSQAQIAYAGLPADSVVYAAADFDVQSGQFGACDDYLRGFASVLGLGRTGIYGGLHYLNHAHAVGVAVRFWQAGATSWDHGEAPQMPLDLHQTTKTPPLPGTDHNYVLDTTTLAGNGGALPLGDEFDMASLADLEKILDARISASEDRDRRESRARVYQRHELPGKPLWIEGPHFEPRQLQADNPQRHDKDLLKGDTLLVDAGDFITPQPISEVAWALLIEEHDRRLGAIADAVVAKLAAKK